MKWKKLGMIFTASGQHDWMTTHAANPVAEHRAGDVFRVYFGCRDARKRSHIGYLDMEVGSSIRILQLAQEPLVAPGPLGAFDDSGVSMACVVRRGTERYLYYLGWNLSVTVPWRNSIGLAISAHDDKPFRKVSRAPIMDRSDVDPFTLSYPWVSREGRRWKMWYGSNLTWGARETDMNHVIKYAESDDGIHWKREGVIALELRGQDYALCRPCVLRDKALYRMWYCHRGGAYRLGYAESADGIGWTRRPELAGLEVSPTGWDSEMIAYPCVFVHRDRHYLLYNGNRYGLTGFGLAVEE